MDKSQIAIFAAVAVALGFRLYKKYGNKGNLNTNTGSKPKDSSFPSSVKDEGYEPYSKK